MSTYLFFRMLMKKRFERVLDYWLYVHKRMNKHNELLLMITNVRFSIGKRMSLGVHSLISSMNVVQLKFFRYTSTSKSCVCRETGISGPVQNSCNLLIRDNKWEYLLTVSIDIGKLLVSWCCRCLIALLHSWIGTEIRISLLAYAANYS
jgi:hypothetical protein